jgi:hypothetical protein
VVLSITRINHNPNIEPWSETATGFLHRDTYPLALRITLCYLCRIYAEHLVPTPMRFFPSRHQDSSLVSPHEKPEAVPPPRRPFVPCSCLPRLPG